MLEIVLLLKLFQVILYCIGIVRQKTEDLPNTTPGMLCVTSWMSVI